MGMLSVLRWEKAQLHSDSNKGFLFCLSFVWRQSELAFFSASASVGALFYFGSTPTIDIEPKEIPESKLLSGIFYTVVNS